MFFNLRKVSELYPSWDVVAVAEYFSPSDSKWIEMVPLEDENVFDQLKRVHELGSPSVNLRLRAKRNPSETKDVDYQMSELTGIIQSPKNRPKF